MVAKDLSVIQGDTLTLGIRVTGGSGPIDLGTADSTIHASITDLSGRRVIARFQVIPVDLFNGEFQVHLTSTITSRLRGKHLWSIRYERGPSTKTLVGGEILVGPVK